MAGKIVLLLVIVNAIRLIGVTLGYDIPAIPNAGTIEDETAFAAPPLHEGNEVVDDSGGCSLRIIFAIPFPVCTGEASNSFLGIASKALLFGINLIVFLLNMVLGLFVVPVWLFTIPDIPIELRTLLAGPIVIGYGFVGYQLIRRG